jgi:1-acyl-sn-glycerol-3-phosphate acyltransferase
LKPVRGTHLQPATTQPPTEGIGLWLSRLRSYLFWDPLIWLYTIVLGGLSLLASIFDRNGRIQHGFARLWSRMILGTIGARVRVEGLEKIDTRTARIYAVNHLSALDIPVLYKCLPFQFRILAKKELFQYPFMGWHMRRSGQIPIIFEDLPGSKAGSGSSGTNAEDLGSSGGFSRLRQNWLSLAQGVTYLKTGMPIVIFPEGGRSESGQLQPFMRGAFWLALKAQVEVVPLAIVGTYEMLPVNSFHIRSHPVQLLVGEPIPTQGTNIRALTQKAREAIANLYYSRSLAADSPRSK